MNVRRVWKLAGLAKCEFQSTHPGLKKLYSLALLGAVAMSSGCTICAPGYLDDYATVGGKWQRTDPANGRVGSPFSDPNFMAIGGDDGEAIYYEGVDDSGMQLDGQSSYPPELDGTVIELDGSQSEVEVVPSVIELGDDW